jgi:cyclophilin family peptidyl-prolyl cis-trans isomerase
VLARLVKENPEDLRVVYRNFPLVSIHDKAAIAMQAAEAAGAQGKFWEMHDLLFDRQSDWSSKSVDDFKTWVTEQAVELGLDKAQFSADMNSDAAAAKAQAAWDKGVSIGLPGTPFLLFNGRPYQGPLNYSNVSAIVQMILLEKRQFTTCPPMTIDQSKQYFATLKTEKGDIVLQLYADKAPLAVNSFVFLANQGWFNGITFHRVIPGYVAQTGDPSGSGYGGPGYAFDNEISTDLKFDAPGVVGMANAGAGTNGSQFFITMAPEPKLDGSYTIFGRVVSGMDVVNNLTPRDPSQGDNLPPGDKLISVTIEEK